MQFHYFKMHGAGNRILIVDARRTEASPPPADRILELGDANTGPGFDQLMWLAMPCKPPAVASYRVFNADGSEVEQCGNGVRCLAWLLSRQGSGDALMLESPAGPVQARIEAPGRVAVDMGAPVFDAAKVPFLAEKSSISYELDVYGEILEVAVLSMGNPHCIIDVDDVATADVDRVGAAIERHSRFPERTNVGFMHVDARDRISLRVYERGVGETLACGTGACAAAVAARRRDRVDEVVTVRLPGGELVVKWRGPTGPVWLTGNAELTCEGSIEL